MSRSISLAAAMAAAISFGAMEVSVPPRRHEPYPPTPKQLELRKKKTKARKIRKMSR